MSNSTKLTCTNDNNNNDKINENVDSDSNSCSKESNEDLEGTSNNVSKLINKINKVQSTVNKFGTKVNKIDTEVNKINTKMNLSKKVSCSIIGILMILAACLLLFVYQQNEWIKREIKLKGIKDDQNIMLIYNTTKSLLKNINQIKQEIKMINEKIAKQSRKYRNEQAWKPEIDSRILTLKEKQALFRFMPQNLINKKWKLLYRASEHNFSSKKFHSLCDNKGPTVTIVHSEFNHVFGGYASTSWNKVINNFTEDINAFIFVLRQGNKSIPQKWTIKNANYAIFNHVNYGPIFGGGHDFRINDNCNINTDSYSNLGHSYFAPNDNNLLAGSYWFKVKEYEVYGFE